MATRIKNLNIEPIDFRYDEGFRGRVDTDVSPTLTTKASGYSGMPLLREKTTRTITTKAGNRMDDNYIIGSEMKIKNATKKGYLIAHDGDGIDISSRMKYHRGTVQKGITQTLTTAGGDNVGVMEKLRIRKLTPLECLKLMGFSEEDYNAISKEFSNSAIYHVAGDTIITTCLMSIFGTMLDVDYRTKVENHVESLKTN